MATKTPVSYTHLDVRPALRHIERIFPGIFAHVSKKLRKILLHGKLLIIRLAMKMAFILAVQEIPLQKISFFAALKAQLSAETAISVPGLPADALLALQAIEHGQDKFMYLSLIHI